MTDSHRERVTFLVDGFNLYHSVCRAERVLPGRSLKWLDLQSLFRAHLDLVSRDCVVGEIRYFTAYAYHLAHTDPGKIARHKAYTRALTAEGVQISESHFKQKVSWDTRSGQRFLTHEEKETDVAIACAVFEGAATNQFDTVVVVTGDTDLRPAVLTFCRLFPRKRFLFAFPFDRKNKELASIAPGSFSFSAEAYAKHQFPERVRLPSGKVVIRPAQWSKTPGGDS